MKCKESSIKPLKGVLMKVIGVTLLTSMISIINLPTAFAINFSDVESNHWAYNYISTLTDSKVINGYNDGTFRPNGTITNGEFIKLVMASCMPPYIDISEAEPNFNHWAAPYVWLAETYGLIDTNDINAETVDLPITRIEMVRLISKADIIMKNNPQQFETETEFMDVAMLQLNDLYLLRHAVSRGLITGYTDGTFKPDQTMTRAEAATMIYRFTR